MFDTQLIIYGKYAEILKKYSKDKQGSNAISFTVTDNDGQKKNIYIFDSYLQGYMVSALLGIYNNKTLPDDEKRDVDAKIFADILSKHRSELEDIVETMVLSETGVDSDKRIRNAFNVQRDNSKDLEIKLNSYVRGGLVIIDEMFSKCKTYEDIANRIILLKQELSEE